MMVTKRIMVTGTAGQVVDALRRRAGPDFDVLALGRPSLDLEDLQGLEAQVFKVAPDAIVSVAAYTAVDAAEADGDRAMRVNGHAPGVLAAVADRLGIPILHLSTDYVFDGRLDRPYRESDPVGPQSVYGATKLAGERAVMAATARHVILRTAWVYSGTGKNFVKTMLRLGQDRDEVGVVADQLGNPTSAADIADGVLTILRQILVAQRPEYGLFHMAGSGEASWAQFANAIFLESARRGGPHARVREIATSDYPTPAPRPSNSRLDCGQLYKSYGLILPQWHQSLALCLDSLVGPALS